MTKSKWLYLFLAAALGAVLFMAQVDREARRINKRLDRLRSVVEKQAGEGHLVTLAKSQEVVNFFTPEAVIRLRPVLPHQVTRREVSSVFYQVHSRVDSLTIRFSDRRLAIDRKAGTADMRFTARGMVRQGEYEDMRMHEFELHWVKRDREWYIERADIVQAIRPPGS